MGLKTNTQIMEYWSARLQQEGFRNTFRDPMEFAEVIMKILVLKARCPAIFTCKREDIQESIHSPKAFKGTTHAFFCLN